MFTEFDVIVSVILMICVISSFLRGAVKDVLSLLGYIGAAAITLVAFPWAASMAEDWFKSSIMINIVAVVGVYFSALILISLVNSILLSAAKGFRFGFFDRTLGLAFGLIKGLVVVSALHYMITAVANDEPDWLTQGQTYEITSTGAGLLSDVVGGNYETIKDAVIEGQEKFKDDAENLGDNVEEKIEDIEEKPIIDIPPMSDTTE